MRSGLLLILGWLVAAASPMTFAQSSSLNLPKSVAAGAAFSIQSTGSGKGVLYFVGPGQVIRRDVNLGENIDIAQGVLTAAGNYVVILTGNNSAEQGQLVVTPADDAAHLSFLARPSRLPVNLHNGISGAVYVFDAYHNLITKPKTVSFQLTPASGATQQHKATTVDGAAWTQMDSTSKQGDDKFVAQVEGVSSKRIVQQVPGEPCGLKMSAKPAGQQIEVQTAPVRDCSGNAVPDGTIVTFTEDYNGTQSTVDVPLKRDIATIKLPAHDGARISVASGVVLGNEIHWGKE